MKKATPFAEKLNSLRRELGLTQAELARLLDVSPDSRLAKLKTELIIWMVGLLMGQTGLLWALLHKA